MDISEKLDSLKKNYVDSLKQKIFSIESLQAQLNAQRPQEGVVDEFHMLAHKIHGSAATYGLSQISQTAQKLENLLSSQRDQNNLTKADLELINHTTNELTYFIHDTDLTKDAKQISLPLSCKETFTIGLYILNPDFLTKIKTKLSSYGYDVCTLADETQLKEAVHNQSIQILISELDYLEEQVYQLILEQESEQSFHHIMISDKNSQMERLFAVRAGADHFFQMPFQVDELVVYIDHFKNKQNTPFNILIIEDDKNVASYFSLLLEEAGMNTKVITNPMQFEFAVNDFPPDLILSDMYMPKCSGIELAKIIRQQDQFSTVPILFLSAEQDKHIQLAAMSAGVEDFITKLVSPKYLILNIRNRANRYRELSNLLHFDSLTKVYNHTAIQKELEAMIKTSQRYNEPVSVAMLDLDHFKMVNDTYGHLAGDQVLKNLSVLIKNRLRESDKVGRHGGEEFLVILPGCDEIEAFEILESVRKKFADIKHAHGTDTFQVTLSGGIASTYQFEEVNKLIKAADSALYQAKENGRNQLELFKKPEDK